MVHLLIMPPPSSGQKPDEGGVRFNGVVRTHSADDNEHADMQGNTK